MPLPSPQLPAAFTFGNSGRRLHLKQDGGRKKRLVICFRLMCLLGHMYRLRSITPCEAYAFMPYFTIMADVAVLLVEVVDFVDQDGVKGVEEAYVDLAPIQGGVLMISEAISSTLVTLLPFSTASSLFSPPRPRETPVYENDFTFTLSVLRPSDGVVSSRFLYLQKHGRRT
ncbi:hypothetical protein BDQ17DRAFT_1435608 [Cyathus striatus]|nr:hypothetical protein BDQ17DRAFT_1435608 [Cyathus striatus]